MFNIEGGPGPLNFANLFPRFRIVENNPKERDADRAVQIVGLYRGWDILEEQIAKRGNKSKVEVVDSDVSGIDRRHVQRFGSREEVANSLEELIRPLEKYIDAFTVDDQRKELYAQLKASRFFLEALKFRLDLYDFVKNTMGVELREINEDEILLRRDLVIESLAKLGFKGNLKEAFLDFRNNNRLLPDRLKDEMIKLCEIRLPKLKAYLSFSGLDPRYDSPSDLIRFEDRPEFVYRMESYYRDGRPQVVVNKAMDFYEGEAEYFVNHEIAGHGFDQDMLRLRVARGEVIPELGLRTLHGPQVYAREGGAQTLQKFLHHDFFDMSKQEVLAYRWRELMWLVLNNAHIIVNEPGNREQKITEATRYCTDRLQVLTPEEIGKTLRQRVEEPLERTSPYVYGIAILGFSNIALKLRTLEKRREFLTKYYGVPLTPDHVNYLASSVASTAEKTA